MSAELETKGFEEILNNLQSLGRKGSRIENIALKSGGEIVRKQVEENAQRSNIDHEHLKDNIVCSNIKNKMGVKSIEVKVDKKNTKIFWDVFNEFGTSKMPANHFMSNGFNDSKEEALSKITEVMIEGLKL